MGGCCGCSSRQVEWNQSPRFYHYPAVSEDRQPLSSCNGADFPFPSGLVVDTNLETSIPDIYGPPPAPIPYDANIARPQSPLNNLEGSGNKREAPSEPVEETNVRNNGDSDTVIKEAETIESDCKEQNEVDYELEMSGELKKPNAPFLAPEECPTCFEEYDEENPKIITKCEHHFHLSCILEWLERSDTCPVCDQEMIINFPIDE